MDLSAFVVVRMQIGYSSRLCTTVKLDGCVWLYLFAGGDDDDDDDDEEEDEEEADDDEDDDYLERFIDDILGGSGMIAIK